MMKGRFPLSIEPGQKVKIHFNNNANGEPEWRDGEVTSVYGDGREDNLEIEFPGGSSMCISEESNLLRLCKKE